MKRPPRYKDHFSSDKVVVLIAEFYCIFNYSSTFRRLADTLTREILLIFVKEIVDSSLSYISCWSYLNMTVISKANSMTL